MRLSLSWVVLLLFGIIFLILAVQGKKVYEAFQDKPPEGFTSTQTDDIILTSCPANTNIFVDDAGNSVCCDGIVENGKCVGKEVCSISKEQTKYPTCGRYWAAILEERGRDRCPVSMPNYFENMTNNEKGCTQGRRTRDGSAALPGEKFCKLYNSKKDEEEKIDSCSNQEMLEKAVCFKKPIDGVKKGLVKLREGPIVIQCSYTHNGNTSSCYTNNSLHRLYKYEVEKGRQSPKYVTDLEPMWKFSWCNQQETVAIDKKLKIEDLKYVNLETGVYSPPPAPPAPPPPPPPSLIAPPTKPVLKGLKHLGWESDVLYAPPNSILRYGIGERYVKKNVSGWFRATNQFFGGDPLPGTRKAVALEMY